MLCIDEITELKIAQAYVRLSCIPADSSEASVSLASIGSYELRMLRWPEVDLDAVPLSWLELFDHKTKTAVDSFCCHRIKDAVPIFDDFVAQAGVRSNPMGRADEGLPGSSGSPSQGGGGVSFET